MVAADENKRSRVYRADTGPWSLTELRLTMTSIISLALESVRWALQGRFPALLHPASSGAPEGARLFYVAE